MQKNIYVPILSSPAGNCLTKANWQEAGFDRTAVYLDELLMKPGLEVLQQCSDLKSFIGWDGKIILNCYFAVAEKNGSYRLRSRYDGSIINLTVESLYAIVGHLQPDAVLLPCDSGRFYNEFWQHLPKNMQLYFAIDDSVDSICRYLPFKASQSFDDYLIKLEQEVHPLYLTGEFNYSQLKTLLDYKKHWVETDKPAADAMQGIMYCDAQLIDINDAAYCSQHQPLQQNCSCRTCEQHFTKAYFHHLLQHTPLLCQRLLIQHNVSQFSV